MARTLRARKFQPNYTSIIGVEDNGNEAGPSTVALDDDSSGSDFTPETETKKSRKSLGVVEDERDDEDELVGDDEEEPLETPQILSSKQIGVKSKSRVRKGKGPVSVAKSTVSKPTTLSGSFRRQMYTLPTPSVHHRHRAVPLYSVLGRVERLTSRPGLFSTPDIVLTNNFTMNATIIDRLNKAWGYNVGAGPFWELVEDRGWFKEARGLMESESNRRPKVHENVNSNGWTFLSIEEASTYLPTDDITTEEGNFRPPPPIRCSFGPFGSQTTRATEMLTTFKMADLIPDSSAHVFNAGAPAWGIDWCPLHPNTQNGYTHYLAVGPLSSPSHSPEIGVRVQRPSRACIQIWSFGSDADYAFTDTRRNGNANAAFQHDPGKMRCDLVLCIGCGPAYELRWCPLPSPSAQTSLGGRYTPKKLGLLSGTFEDGSFAIFAIPDPKDISPPEHNRSGPIYIKLPNPVLRIELEEACCWSIDWANSEVVAIGMTNGSIGVYDVGSALKQINDTSYLPITDLLPTHYLNVHQAAIRALAWVRAPTSDSSGEPRFDEDPIVLGSGGTDGVVCLTNIRSGHGSVMNRTRDVINSMSYSSYGGGPVTVDHDDAVKAYSASPKMLGRGHMLVEPQGPVWVRTNFSDELGLTESWFVQSISASDFHPQLAVGAADGTCTTTNLLRSTRRGGSVPFFAHKIYQLDYNRTSKEFRMLEQFFPQETQDRGAANNPNNVKLRNAANDERGTGVWPREVGVQRVVWNSGSGLAAAGMLASATGSGLCRVDVLSGRWLKEKSVKMPYGGVENIRLEGDNVVDDMDIDSDEGSI
ncbi:hypothetical protein J3R30DRAFT_3695362 [Lentinula aciculospora]|uniref:WD40 repeat-like protein n=1 Tax=Lentinula aciculospora TaxID=153920 RepID=A0A9W9AS16_9AGAR|nr:hypothetical protein J3R30DRAFT_3695362 [Lentinula aciculospora]